MGTTSDKLLYLQDTKAAIKNAIVAKGVSVPVGTTFRNYATKIGEITTGGGGSEIADAWVRPTEWLALPDNVDGVQKVSILNAVFDTDSEFVAFTCRGSYTVDWGDGVVKDYPIGVTVEHKYDYSNVNLNSATVTKFGYKQCIITITPQAGESLTMIDLSTFHSTIGGNTDYDLTTGFLDMRINSLSCTNLTIGHPINYVKHTMLEQCLIGELADTTLDNLFYDCYALQSVTIKDTSNVTSFTSMHCNNYSLQKMPTYNYTSATTLAFMLDGCFSLKSVPNFNITASCTNLASLCNNCRSLEKAPTFSDSSGVTNISSMLSNCKCLTTIPSYIFGDIAASSGLASFASGCSSLQVMPSITVGSSYTANTSILNTCYSLKRMLMPLRFTFSVANAKMSATALNEMYSILPTVTGQTVTVTGNYGVSKDDPSIATAKGWTVTG